MGDRFQGRRDRLVRRTASLWPVHEVFLLSLAPSPGSGPRQTLYPGMENCERALGGGRGRDTRDEGSLGFDILTTRLDVIVLGDADAD